MTSVSFGVGCERKSIVLRVWLTFEPLLLFRHRRGVRPEKGETVDNIVEYVIIQFSAHVPRG